MKSHRESFPEQYQHPMVGKPVFVTHRGREVFRGTVTRVVQSRFGQLAHFEGTDKAYRVIDCEYVTGDAPGELAATESRD